MEAAHEKHQCTGPRPVDAGDGNGSAPTSRGKSSGDSKQQPGGVRGETSHPATTGGPLPGGDLLGFAFGFSRSLGDRLTSCPVLNGTENDGAVPFRTVRLGSLRTP